jgi:KaiC/GvpD/RAD55 family RecA-like ATPase
MANKYVKMLNEMSGFVDHQKDYFVEGVRTPSSSVNFVFGNTHLIPFGASCILWGPPKGGKSLISSFMIGQLHKDYPDAIAIKINTELREHFQMTPRSMKMFGIDPDRYAARNTGKAEEIFDFIEKEVVDLCQKGAKIKLIVIDSITDIMGRNLANAESVGKFLMGDDAATQQAGLRRIRSVLREWGITLVMISQERAVLDPVEIMRGKKTKMAGAFYLKHFAEYFVYVAPNESKEGKEDFLGHKLEDESLTDMVGNSEKAFQKVKVVMNDSSVGIAKRAGEFTFHKFKGIVNMEEEAFKMACARNVLERPNNRTYVLKDWPSKGQQAQWVGKEETLTNIRLNDDLAKELVNRVKAKDIDQFRNGIEDTDTDITTEIADDQPK